MVHFKGGQIEYTGDFDKKKVQFPGRMKKVIVLKGTVSREK